MLTPEQIEAIRKSVGPFSSRWVPPDAIEALCATALQALRDQATFQQQAAEANDTRVYANGERDEALRELDAAKDGQAALVEACVTYEPGNEDSVAEMVCHLCDQRWDAARDQAIATAHSPTCPLSNLAASAAQWRAEVEREALEEARQQCCGVCDTRIRALGKEAD